MRYSRDLNGVKMNRISKIFALIFNILVLSGISSISTARAEDALRVFVSIVPQKYFVEKIGGEFVDVSVMVRPGASPATYEPKPRQMVALSKARIYFAIGVPFENTWLKKLAAANPKMMVVHTEDGIEKIPMKTRHHHDEEKYHHKNKGRHHYGIKNPHVWLAPPLVMIQARNILGALTRVDPANRAVFETNYKNFIRELVELDLKIRDIFAGKEEGKKFMVYHPAWGYFAGAYGLKQIPVEIEGKEPTPKQLQNLIRHAGEDGVKVIFVQPQFSAKSAEIIAKAIGGQVVFSDPLSLNWAENLIAVAEKFKEVLK